MIVVSDTGPLNYLALIGHIDKLPVLYGRVIVPAAVAEELAHEHAPVAVRQFIGNPPAWLDVHSVVEMEGTVAGVDLGEAQAIMLAQAISADLLLCDDGHARAVAKSLHLRTIGTPGVLMEAANLGLLDLADAVARLRQTTFRASDVLLEQVLAAARNLGPRQQPPD